MAAGLVYVGIKRHVVALDRRTGDEVWRTELGGSSTFVCVFRDGDLLFATCSGEIFCLDPKTGTLLWHNRLKGLGMGFTSMAGDNTSTSSSVVSTVAAETQRRQAAAAAAAG
jgi:outer membrane protein assembly factor BamB